MAPRNPLNDPPLCFSDIHRAYNNEEIGFVLGITRQSVDMIVLRALAKLKRNCIQRGITLKDLLPLPDPREDEQECLNEGP